MEKELRNPVQKRAIEKKQNILKNGFKLMCEKGYHNTDCIQIAKAANVSTGTVYQYFSDKKDIFIQGLKSDEKLILFPILEFKDKTINETNTKELIKIIIDKSIKNHKISKTAHEEIMAMKYSDEEVNKIFKDYEIEATEVLVKLLINNNVKTKDIYEKSHLIIAWIDDLCHEVIYHKHQNLDYDKMTNILVDTINNILN